MLFYLFFLFFLQLSKSDTLDNCMLADSDFKRAYVFL
jgi:hypothetical protein